MTGQAEQARREYMAEWRKKNADKVRESDARYWERRAKAHLQENGQKETPAAIAEAAAEIRRAYFREWGKKNRDKRRAATARYWERKAEKIANEQRTGRKES